MQLPPARTGQCLGDRIRQVTEKTILSEARGPRTHAERRPRSQEQVASDSVPLPGPTSCLSRRGGSHVSSAHKVHGVPALRREQMII